MRSGNTAIYCCSQFAKCGFAPWVTPRKIVEQHRFVGVCANGNDIAHCFINTCQRHALGIEDSKPWVNANANGESMFIEWLGNHHAITVAVAAFANEWSHGSCAPNFVVVPMDNGSLACNVGVTKQCHQHIGDIVSSEPLGRANVRIALWCWHHSTHVSLWSAVV